MHSTRTPGTLPPQHASKTPTTRERILDAAAALFSREGYTGVSIRDITRAVGIKESSLYNHFRNKEAVLESLLDRMEEEFAGRRLPENFVLAQIRTSSPHRYLRESFRRFTEFWENPLRVRLWLVVSMEQYRNARAGQLVLDETRRVREQTAFAFAAMRRLKKIRPLDPALLADMFAGTLRAMQLELAILVTAGKRTRGVEKRMDAFITFFATMIMP